MKRQTRLVFILIATLISIGLLGLLLVVAGQAGSVTSWQTEVNRYVGYEMAAGAAPMHVAASSRAQRPSQFTAALGGPTFGQPTVFLVDHPYRGRAPGPQALPYPPSDVWCVLLEDETPGGQPAQRRVVFVARHESLYNADWVVHGGQIAPFSPDFIAGLQQIGCNLKVAP